jgi:hypothetical protein
MTEPKKPARPLVEGVNWEVDPETGCWKWLGYINPLGYGATTGGGAHATMNCEDLRVLEYWTRKTNVFREWKRLPNLEIVLPDGRDDQLEGKR